MNVIGNLTIEGVDGVTLSLGQNSIVNNGNLTLDITKDKLDDIKNYALSHTSDQTLEYIKHSQAVSQDSGWKMTDAAGNPVTDPYAAVESPKLDGYTATIKSTNAPGVTQGADGSEVQAKLKINPDAVVKDGELTDAFLQLDQEQKKVHPLKQLQDHRFDRHLVTKFRFAKPRVDPN